MEILPRTWNLLCSFWISVILTVFIIPVWVRSLDLGKYQNLWLFYFDIFLSNSLAYIFKLIFVQFLCLIGFILKYHILWSMA